MARRNKNPRKSRRRKAAAIPLVPFVNPEPHVAPPPAIDCSRASVTPILDVMRSARVTVPELKAVVAPAATQPVLVASPEQGGAKAATVAESSEAVAERAVLDDIDEAFFRQGNEIESQPPGAPDSSVADDIEREHEAPPPPEVLARRSKLRKFVGAVVGLGALVLLGGLGKTVASGRPTAMTTRPTAASGFSVTERAAPVSETAVDRRGAEARQQPSPLPDNAEPKADAIEPQQSEVPVAEVPEGKSLREALNLLNRGKFAEAIPMARAAIRQDPSHALGYLYLGTALQETGDHKKAIATYCDCVRSAKQGPVWECRAMGGRK